LRQFAAAHVHDVFGGHSPNEAPPGEGVEMFFWLSLAPGFSTMIRPDEIARISVLSPSLMPASALR
jgi:hypothetical protein